MPAFEIHRDCRIGEGLSGDVVGFTPHYNVCKFRSLEVFLT